MFRRTFLKLLGISGAVAATTQLSEVKKTKPKAYYDVYKRQWTIIEDPMGLGITPRCKNYSFGMPPFHPRCRCIIVNEDQSVKIITDKEIEINSKICLGD